ncbi:MAG TPA: hypothetical protein VFQ36_21905 [Ktedonobacteraceae bacterium]|nr:hypothetical protein [Ktedonobacteraceae bacterium]
MPKKTASARGGASRNRPKPQKNIQLVRPDSASTATRNDRQDESGEEETTLAAPTSKGTNASTATASKAEIATTKKSDKKSEVESETTPKEKEEVVSAPDINKGSAAARLAARRQSALKQQAQRNVSLITSEHYAYVKRDLIYILILAVIMFSAIIVMHFIPAIGG